ncbi:hemolysin family protein [Rarispira pelagica]
MENTEAEKQKQDMIKGIEELSETTVKEVMVPRIDVVFIDLSTPLDEILEVLADCGHSRVPVFENTIDNVVGILYVKDVLRMLVKKQDIDLKKIIRAPYFIPDSKRLDALLREMKKKRVHIAIAVDEYGGVSGIVCLEDIIEEIVGDILDEFDNEEEEFVELDSRTFLCDGRINLEELEDAIGIEIDSPDIDTLGGFVFELLGKIPVRYEKVEYNGIIFIVQDVEGHKIKRVKIVLPEDYKKGERVSDKE